MTSARLKIEASMEGPFCTLNESCLNGNEESHVRTGSWPAEPVEIELREIASQTCEPNSVYTSTMCDQGTQMGKVGVFISSTSDRVVCAGDKYTFSASVLVERERSAIRIQCNIRACLARVRVKRLRLELLQETQREAERIAAKEKARFAKAAFETERRIRPRTILDVRLLLTEINGWVVDEVNKLKDRFKDDSEFRNSLAYRAGLKKILAESIRRRSRIKLLKSDKIECKSKVIATRAGLVEVINEQEEARVSLLNRLRAEPPASISERINVVEEAQKFLSESFEGEEELGSLLSRELELLRHKRPLKTMPGLRLRILNIFKRLLLHD